MAKFRISLLDPAGEVILTDFNFNNQSVLTSSTYDERVTFDDHSSNTLDFRMSKYLFANGQKILNQFAFNIVHGSKIRLLDKNSKSFDFYVVKISYELRAENIIISFNCQSSFSYELTKRNIGYTIENELTSLDFIGALRLDDWARKIKEECRINWGYTPVDTRNKNILNTESFNELRTFSISNSNAYNALVSLAESYGMYLDVDYNNQVFSFIPSKSPRFKGLFLNPYHNLQELSVSTSSQSMATILTITGLTDIDDNEIGLLPDIPQSIVSWFGTEEWELTNYEPLLYYNFLEELAEEEDRPLNETELQFIRQIENVPWLENRIINFDYFRVNGFFSENEYKELYDKIYNKLRIINGKRIYLTSQYLFDLSETNSLINTFNNINLTNTLAALEYGIGRKILNQSDLEAFERFDDNYILYLNETEKEKKLINKSTLLTEQINLFDSAHQRFLKNIFLFRKTWEEKGEFYATNINQTNDAIVIELASIKKKLTQYWNAAKVAGKFTNYWIPDTWDNIAALPTATFTDFFAIIKNGNDFVINDAFIPKIIEEENPNVIWQYVDVSKNVDLTPGPEWEKATSISGGSYTRDEFVNGNIVQISYNIYSDPYVIDLLDPNYFFKIDLGNKKYYKIDPVSPGAATYSLVYAALSSQSATLEGIYLALYNYIKNSTEIRSDFYRNSIKLNRDFWIDLYNNYPAVFLEATYKNETATTPELLYKAASNKFQELSNPEPEYSVTAIDLKNITGIDLYELELGDQIRIEDNAIETKPDELKRLLQQRLFISKIDYTLRSDDNIKLTVNPVRYDDVLLDRLVKLLVI